MFAKLLPEIENKNQGEHRHKMLMLLDSFIAFGKIEAFEKAVEMSSLQNMFQDFVENILKKMFQSKQFI